MEATLSSTNTYTKQQWIAEQARSYPDRSSAVTLRLADQGRQPLERTCQVRNRVRQLRTPGSVGGGP